jgi:hypothetical protein
MILVPALEDGHDQDAKRAPGGDGHIVRNPDVKKFHVRLSSVEV